MKKILVFLCAMFVCVVAFAQTINVTWKVGNTTYASNTCEYGGTLTVPSTPPTKYGYTFRGWGSYTFLEYIESTGTQYIDTGYKPTIDGYKAKIKFELTSTLLSQDIIGFNYLYNNIRQRKGLGLNTSGKSIFGFGKADSGYATIPDLSLNTLYENEYVFVNPCSYTINGVPGTQTYTGSVDDTDNIYLIAINTHAEVRGSTGKWYYCQLWDNNGVMVRNLVPAKRNSDNVLGMYDTVSQTFFTNAGTGEFIAGPAK